MSSVPVVMAHGAAPDAHVYMIHAGMMDRVRYLEQWSIQHKQLCDEQPLHGPHQVLQQRFQVGMLTQREESIEALQRNERSAAAGDYKGY